MSLRRTPSPPGCSASPARNPKPVGGRARESNYVECLRTDMRQGGATSSPWHGASARQIRSWAAPAAPGTAVCKRRVLNKKMREFKPRIFILFISGAWRSLAFFTYNGRPCSEASSGRPPVMVAVDVNAAGPAPGRRTPEGIAVGAYPSLQAPGGFSIAALSPVSAIIRNSSPPMRYTLSPGKTGPHSAAIAAASWFPARGR